MDTNKRDFDKEAATWDENPVRIKLADDVAQAIARDVPLHPGMDVLDFGCGTGLVSLQLRPHVRSVTGVDSSAGMLEVFASRAAAQGLSNVEALRIDLDQGGALPGRYHLIVSSMALHHIQDVDSLLKRFYDVTAPSGHVSLADLDPEEGQFHASNEGVFHHGFDRAALRKTFENSGFVDVSDSTAAEVVKPASNGELRCFSVFLMIGRRP